MTQQQQQIIEDYLFDVFVKLDGVRKFESNEDIESWWNHVFLLEAITSMGQHNYNIADFCKPNVFFGTRYDQEDGEQNDQEDGEQNDQEDGEQNDQEDGEQRIKYVVSYLNNFYQHEDYYDYFIGNGMFEQEPGQSILQIQYLYVYTVENSQYFMNKFIYGNDIILK
jgi:hypothetical protein